LPKPQPPQTRHQPPAHPSHPPVEANFDEGDEGPLVEVQDGEQTLERPMSESEKILGPVGTEMPNEGPYLDDAWVDKLPYIAERLGVPAGANMSGPSFVLYLDDGRSYDLLLMGHRALDLIQQSLGQSNECMKAASQLMGGLQQLQQQIVAQGSRLAEIEKKLGIEPPVGAPGAPKPRGIVKT
jgi:hypothetical protein